MPKHSDINNKPKPNFKAQ